MLKAYIAACEVQEHIVWIRRRARLAQIAVVHKCQSAGNEAHRLKHLPRPLFILAAFDKLMYAPHLMERRNASA